MSKYIEIKPSHLNQDYYKKDGVPGVYVWGFYQNINIFIPLYVGKSRNTFERLIQHYCRFKAGEYSIFNKQDLVDIYCNKLNTKVPSKVYAPISVRSIFNFSNGVNPDHVFMVANFTFRYIKVLDKEIRKQAECYLADLVQREKLITQVNKGNSSSLDTQYIELKKELEKMVN